MRNFRDTFETRKRSYQCFFHLHALREECPNMEFFLVRIFLFSDRKSLYSIRIQENADQKKLRIWTVPLSENMAGRKSV